MNVSLTGELKDFVQKKVKNGQYPSEEAVIEAALTQPREQDESRMTAPTLDDFIDHEFIEYCSREADDGVTLEEVLAIRIDPESGERKGTLLKWGLIPAWAKEPSIGNNLANARADTAQTQATSNVCNTRLIS